jgi:hypothetical protein
MGICKNSEKEWVLRLVCFVRDSTIRSIGTILLVALLPAAHTETPIDAGVFVQKTQDFMHVGFQHDFGYPAFTTHKPAQSNKQSLISRAH